MYIHKIEIQNFRLLEKIELLLEERTTIIVGRNNSGKTSLTELFRRLLSENTPTFRLEDFSLLAHENFWKSYQLKREDKDEYEIRVSFPIIEVKLTINYDKNASNLGILGEFIVDLNPDCAEAVVVIRYELKDGEIESFFSELNVDPGADEAVQRTSFFRTIKERIHKSYEAKIVAQDPGDPTNQKPIEWTQFRKLIQSGFINAQRHLDDTTSREINLLGKILEALLKSADSDSADAEDKGISNNLEKAVEDIQNKIDGDFNKELVKLLPAFDLFGYPGLKDPRFVTQTTLDVQKLLKDHTKVNYPGINGITLPETYNGLGARNLIYILLRLFEFFKTFITSDDACDLNIVFIEEPEVHLHPQMQEVFISKLNEIAEVFSKTYKCRSWPVQFVVTTHSSHLANRASFDSMRYFLATPTKTENVYATQVKDLKFGLGSVPADDREFLHKYMTLTRCDLLFSDKAILIEGSAERLLLPRMTEKIDESRPVGKKIASQYISVVEVGGAYAHRFLQLIKFLELKTLIITDIDTVKASGSSFTKCLVSEGVRTSNACIKAWFDKAQPTPSDLFSKSDTDKVKGTCRLAYQIPEIAGAPCGRSFEQAFMLTNPDLFELTALSNAEKESTSWEKADAVKAKTDFALEFAIQKTNWKVPLYISQGLIWLAEGGGIASVIATPMTAEKAAKDEKAFLITSSKKATAATNGKSKPKSR